ncbi:quinolinate synthase [Candidatus Magnetominusculus xianensis]|uniref:Quinolinate synthase n=1 Tax=Candidatus Magnetominusculus xianensis TaxID=1748249 RepID=A0ABR5SJW4_9BACT|nr:quinolinate synthase [Candidatus Magnetominusculus xianensis]KWT92915.1 quinolinate synthetase [Candidatus Magnetominusculus xianensis]MBF0402919.1 quinolinate synthase [Nitrospirota bacterium]
MNDDLNYKIQRLKEQRNALIIAHNYQRDEVQAIADMTGDSLELSRKAAQTNCDVIVFCGVNFMAESASILSPDKIVLLTASDAFCPMADMISAGTHRELYGAFPGYKDPPRYVYPVEYTLRDIKRDYPGVPVVAYVNTTAEVKAESDICCTSANVVEVIESLPDERVICVPDKNLSAWAAKNTKKEVISWDGYCHVHDRVRPLDVETARKSHPNAVFMAHPECRLDILEMADAVASTSGMLRFAARSSAKEFIVGTEIGLLYRLRKENPEKIFYPLRKDMVCPNMKKTTLQSVYIALREMQHVVKVSSEIRELAWNALNRMITL